MISLEFLLASGVGLLVATGVYLILRARTFPVVLGLAMIGYAVNIFLFAMGRLQLNSPGILKETTKITDPLPQALVLTAIVIGFATTAFIVQLASFQGHFFQESEYLSYRLFPSGTFANLSFISSL